MSSATARRLAWAICAISVALAPVVVGLVVLHWETPTPRGMALGSKAMEAFFPVGALTFSVVGALVASRRPANAIGWVFLTLGFAAEALFLLQQYGLSAVAPPVRFPGAEIALWISTWMWAPAAVLIVLPLALFPDGRLLSPRWRFVLWCAAVGAILQLLSDLLRARVAVADAVIPNPLGVAVADEPLSALYTVGTALWSVALLGAASALIVRLRRARGLEREQLKWFAYASAVSAVLLTAGALVYGTELGDVASGVGALSALGIPVAAGIAIFRHRLYDIDVLINRTLVYGALTATLGLAYLASVVFLQAALRPFTAGSELSVASSTLVVAALFRPLRDKIQAAVDRRFYRAKYDAAKTISGFSSRLRQQIDLDQLSGELVGVVRETMQPAHVSLWLRGERPA